MTPMVDLAFLLLTFFMLTTTLTETYVIPVQMPANDDAGDPPPVASSRVLTLVLGGKNKIYWYTGLNDHQLQQTDYSNKGIGDLLIRKKGEIRKMIILVKPSHDACYQNMVDIIDEMDILELQYCFVKITDRDKALVKEFHEKSLSVTTP